MKKNYLFFGVIILALCLTSCAKKIKTYRNDGVKHGAISNAVFEVNDNGDCVRFSQGNLVHRGWKYKFTKNQQDKVKGDLFTLKQIRKLKFRKGWRLLSYDEYSYILKHHTYKWAWIGEEQGLLLLPKEWQEPDGVDMSKNEFQEDEWKKLQESGAVLLPRYHKPSPSGEFGAYWTSTDHSYRYRYVFNFIYELERYRRYRYVNWFLQDCNESVRCNVRLVQDIK